MTRIHQNRFSQGLQITRCWNKGESVIPENGVMHIIECKFGVKTRKLQYDVRIPTEDDAKLQSHARIAFNAGNAIKPNTKGYATMSLPSAVLIGKYGGSDTIPEDFSTVGPGKDSTKLWKGGITHTLISVINRAKAVADANVKPIGLVIPNTSPGGWIRFDGNLTGSDTGIVVGDGELVWIDRSDDTGTFEIAKSSDIDDAESTMMVRYDHGAGDVTDNEYGQIKLVSGHWALDVQYCG